MWTTPYTRVTFVLTYTNIETKRELDLLTHHFLHPSRDKPRGKKRDAVRWDGTDV